MNQALSSGLALLASSYRVNNEDASSSGSEGHVKQDISNENSRLPAPDIATKDSHEGRVRTFPHVDGAWPTYVCIPFSCNDILEDMKMEAVDVLEMLGKQAHRITGEVHVTLSRTVSFSTDEIKAFETAVRECTSDVAPFEIHIGSDITLYTNDEGTRSFAGASATSMNLNHESNSLAELARRIDGAMQRFGKPAYYSKPRFHCSLAWCLGDCYENEEQGSEDKMTMRRTLRKRKRTDNVAMSIGINSIFVKYGTKMVRVPLGGS